MHGDNASTVHGCGEAEKENGVSLAGFHLGGGGAFGPPGPNPPPPREMWLCTKGANYVAPKISDFQLPPHARFLNEGLTGIQSVLIFQLQSQVVFLHNSMCIAAVNSNSVPVSLHLSR